LAQAIASLIIIFARLIDRVIIYTTLLESRNEIILISLCIKAGIAPFHFWFPQVIKIADWGQCGIILTWQKIAPFSLILSLSRLISVYFIIIASAIVGMLGGLNQISIKNILTYSSITHSAWMLAICSVAQLNTWLLYFIVYCRISLIVVFMRYSLNIFIVKQIFFIKFNKTRQIRLILCILSMGGLPPFLGFTVKLIALQSIIFLAPLRIALILITASLVSLYYYLRLIYPMLIKKTSVSIIYTREPAKSIYIIPSLIIFGNLLSPMIVF